MNRLVICMLALSATIVSALAGPPSAGAPTVALEKISAAGLMTDIRILSSDEFEGRSPGTHGEEMTVAYLEKRFREIGLAPGNPDGTYIQKVPMTAFTSKPTVTFRTGGDATILKTPDDYVGWSSVRRERVQIADSPLVFVGYGVQAPEFGWDDYKGVDVRGKTLVMLINDPPVLRSDGELDPQMFGGKAMTYYGRWTYKFQIARKLGAAAAIIVHETGPAAYPFSVVINSWNGENYSLANDGEDPDFPVVAGWITEARGRELLAKNALDFDVLKKQAVSKDFRPVTLKTTVSFDVQNSWRELTSRNVVARLRGSDKKRRDETIIYSAHWDHFGWNQSLPGPKTRQIFHGAKDNASGTAALLALAQAFKALPNPPGRSVEFIATTGEERGLLGAAYYARHPLYPLRTSVANINMDGINPLGVTRDLEIIGFGKSDMDTLASRAIEAQGRRVVTDLHPERGSFYRADQLEFARAGVPVLYTGAGKDFVDQPPDYGESKTDEYIAKRYHQVDDVIQPDWTFAGGAQDVKVLFDVGYGLASGGEWPQWKPTAEFKAARDAPGKP